MTCSDLIAMLDPARCALAVQSASDLVYWMTSNKDVLEGVSIGLLIGGLIAFGLIQGIYDGLWNVPGWTRVTKWRERRRMRRGRWDAFFHHVEGKVVDAIEEYFEDGHATKTEINEMYGYMARNFPAMRYAMDKEPDDLKERIKERLKNTDRDPSGTVIPVSLPQEGATPKRYKRIWKKSA